MYISREPNRKSSVLAEAEKEKIKKNDSGQATEKFFGEKKEEEVFEPEIEKEEEREIINPSSVLYKWRAPEHEKIEKDKNWFLIAGLVLAVIIIYAIFTDGLIMAITFILLGMVGFIILNKNPRVINFYITDDGVIADKEIYEFENIQSFWIFYENDGLKSISLRLKSKFMPFVHIPLGDEDPTVVREILLNYLEEIKQKPSVIDNFQRFLGI